MLNHTKILCGPVLIIVFILNRAYGIPEGNPALATLKNLCQAPQTCLKEELMDDQQYQSQLNMLLAELESQLLGSEKAQELFLGASKFGLPSFDNLKFRDNYIVSYDNSLKQPIWVLEYLKGARVRRSKQLSRLYDGFDIDESVHEYFRSTNADYMDSRYDRGHFAPACNNKCNQAQLDQSYLLTNVAPQAPSLQRRERVWSRLESYVVHLSRRSKATWVITGSLYLPGEVLGPPGDIKRRVRYRVIGQSRVGVPNYFYKIILYESNANAEHYSMEAFILPNTDKSDGREELLQYRINILRDLEKIEKYAGLQFFELLPRSALRLPKNYRFGFEEVVFPANNREGLPPGRSTGHASVSSSSNSN